MEKRLFPRVYKSLQFEYQVFSLGSAEAFSSQAVMKNISMRGLYFLTEAAPELKADDVADFIFRFVPSRFNPLIPSEIRARARVTRLEEPDENSADFGVAVEFISGPNFIYHD